jgi:alpha-tubulin suppressor-like RCC1 family protein
MNKYVFALLAGTMVQFFTHQMCAATQPEIAAGMAHSLFLKSDGSVWSCGANGGGQLGDGTFSDRHEPVRVIDNVKAIAAGEMHSLFVKADGTAWAVGAGDNGRLGDGSSLTRTTPIQVPISGVKSVAAGKNFSLFLKDDGTVWGCGDRIGLGLGESYSGSTVVPIQIPISNVTAISAGYSHSLFLKADETAWACGFGGGTVWGGNPLGDGTRQTAYLPKQILADCKFVSASCGDQTGSHSLFLSTDGTVNATGGNSWGQLGDGTREGRNAPVRTLISGPVKRLATGSYQSFFIKEDLSVWACGYDQRGELGIGGSGNWRATPVRVFEGAISVASGRTHTIFLKADGTAWAAGMNDRGALGDGSWTDQTIPVRIMSLGTMLNVTSSTGGTVTGGGAFNPNDIAELTAAPALGYLFAGWSGDVTSLDNPLTVTMDSSKWIQAVFTRNTTDLDQDGVSFYDEVVIHKTNPDLADSDGDGFDDLFEINTGFDPSLASSTPDLLSSIRTAVEFRFNAAAGVSYRIEASTDLNQWDVIEPVIIGESGVVTRFYSTENMPKRYFRVRRN